MDFVHKLKDIDENKLSEFVYNHPDGNIFQTPEIYKLYEASSNADPMLTVKVNKDGQIEASYLLSFQANGKGLKRNLSRRAYGIGLPLLTENTSSQEIFDEIGKIVKKKALFATIVNLKEPGTAKHMEECGYEFEPHLNFLIDLRIGEEALWKNLRETKTKIRKGYNKGVTVKISNKIDNVQEYSDILKHTYDRAGLYYDNIVLFEKSSQYLSEKKYIIYLSAYFENKLIAHRAVLIYKDYMYDWFAGNLSEYNKLYPNDILVWEALKWGAQNGYHTFNFGGAGHPDKPYGVREFKKKFGGEMVNYGYMKKVFKPQTYKVLKYFLNIKNKIGSKVTD